MKWLIHGVHSWDRRTQFLTRISYNRAKGVIFLLWGPMSQAPIAMVIKGKKSHFCVSSATVSSVVGHRFCGVPSSQVQAKSHGLFISMQWKVCFSQAMEYYSALKRNELSGHEKTWRNLKCVWLSERSQPEKGTYRVILTTWHSRKGKTMETVNLWRSLVAKGWGQREGWIGGSQGVFRAVKLLCMTS